MITVLGSFILAQAMSDTPVTIPSVNPENVSSLINMSATLVLIPLILIIALFAYIILHSPIGAPVFKRLAEKAFQKKEFSEAARHYAKLHHLQELIEGTAYARKAALSYEMAGNLSEAVRWYGIAEDWGKLGQLYIDTGAMAQAIALFKEKRIPSRLAQCYEQIENYLFAAQIYQFDLQQMHKAELLYRKACQSDDKETLLTAKLMLANLYFHTERKAESLGLFEEVQMELESSVQYQEFPALLQLFNNLERLLQQIPTRPDEGQQSEE